MDAGMEELVKKTSEYFHLFAEFSKHVAIIGQLG
jgi:hypothetical protein